MEPPQALLPHKEPIVSSAFCPGPPWCHGHEAEKWWAESDGYLYRNISFSPPASVHIKHLAHRTSIPSPWPIHLQTHMWRHFLLPLFTVLQCIRLKGKNRRALPPFRQKEWWRETEWRRKCGLTSHLIFSIKSGRRGGLKQNDKSVGESLSEIMAANQYLSQPWKNIEWDRGKMEGERWLSVPSSWRMCDGERQGGERGDGGSCGLLLCGVKETVGSVQAFNVSSNTNSFSCGWQTESRVMCVWKTGNTHGAAFSVFSHRLDSVRNQPEMI